MLGSEKNKFMVQERVPPPFLLEKGHPGIHPQSQIEKNFPLLLGFLDQFVKEEIRCPGHRVLLDLKLNM